jgi:glycosyltransferase involved in cell wall biosynthesis
MTSTKRNVLFLARELSGYFLGCMGYALKEVDDLNVTVVYWPINQEAPFDLQHQSDRLRLIPHQDLNDDQFRSLIGEFKPCIWIVSGWADAKYMRWVKSFRDTKKIVAFDTQWKSELRFLLGSKWLYFKSIRYFFGAWVPGKRQEKLAFKFGIRPSRVKDGFYVADSQSFQFLEKEKGVRDALHIVFINRIVQEKGFPNALIALVDHIKSHHLDWRVTVVGTGPLLDQCPKDDCIEYLGFVQPNDLKGILLRQDVYVLASHYEPWGVSVHEAALCGLPLVLSNEVGASDSFLEPGSNGFLFQSNRYDKMIEAIEKIGQLSDTEYFEFSKRSHELAGKVNLQQWTTQLLDWIKIGTSCAE